MSTAAVLNQLTPKVKEKAKATAMALQNNVPVIKIVESPQEGRSLFLIGRFLILFFMQRM